MAINNINDEVDNMNKTVTFTMASTFLLLSNVALAADIAKGNELSVKCIGCHGATGIGINKTIPNLAGKDIAYLSDKIKAYRDGSLSNPLMNSMVAGISDSDVDNLASYYNSLPSQ